MEKAYIITKGYYNDYHVVAVFLDEKMAQEYCYYENRFFGQDECVIEEYDVNPSIIERRQESVYVQMGINGDVIKCLHLGEKAIGFEGYSLYTVATSEGVHNPLLYWSVDTRDRKKAVKIVNEKRMMIKTANRWGDEDKTKSLFGSEDSDK